MTVQTLEWTPQQISLFWDYCASAAGARQAYFTRRYAKGIANFLAEIAPLSGKRVLDYGCGPGDLVDELLARGALVHGSDCSSKSVDEIQKRYGSHRGWLGAVATEGDWLLFDDGQFDLVCCVETIEHILEDQLQIVLSEVLRVLRSGGVAFLTTPNDERLEQNMIFCPNCRNEFHRWQHVRSWNPENLSRVLSKHGFRVAFCRPVSFTWFQHPEERRSWKDWSPRLAAMALRSAGDRLLDSLAPFSFPHRRSFSRIVGRPGGCHLVAVAEKAAG